MADIGSAALRQVARARRVAFWARTRVDGLLQSDAGRHLQREVDIVRARIMLRGCQLGHRVAAGGPVKVEGRSAICLGDLSFFVGGMLPTYLLCRPGGRITVGESTGINYGTRIESSVEVSLGRRCLVASMVSICDFAGGTRAPVVIGDDVWIAYGAVIAPGVRIGNGSVVSAGSVVTQDVPANMLAVGNPARAVRLDLTRR